MRKSHGWIQPLQTIEHSNAHLNGGRVYLNAEDMRPGVALRPGDLVVFFLYVDSQGLGAEDCFPVRNSGAKPNRKREAETSSSMLEQLTTPCASPASTANCVPNIDVNDDSFFDECTSQAACSAGASTATSPPQNCKNNVAAATKAPRGCADKA
jgi:hypothetical protein